jgi:4-hydroxy 2-oxovalerate aldolase
VPDTTPVDFIFVSNVRRFKDSAGIYNAVRGAAVICTSNITAQENANMIIINYSDYLNSDAIISDNAGLMLLNMLHKIGVREITLAGFDGFNLNNDSNYVDDALQNNVDNDYLTKMNTALAEQLAKLTRFMNISFLTGTKYKQPENDEI